MNLSDLLKPEAVKVIFAASSKKRLLHDVADLAQEAYGLSAHDSLHALLDRENLGPTGVGNGVALPHARCDGLDGVKGVFILLEKPIDFNAVDRQPVDLCFALFAPQEAGVEHLKALAAVSRALRDTTMCSKLRANADPAKLYAILTEVQSVQAA